jgi:anti-sigma-K factor RskA
MTIDNEKFEELSSAYVLDALDIADRREFEKMFAQASDEQKKFSAALSNIAQYLPASVEFVEPPPEIKERLLARVRILSLTPEEGVLGKIARSVGFANPPFALGVAFALVLLVVGLSVYSWFLQQTVELNKHDLASTHQTLADQQQRLVKLQNELAKKEELLQILQAPKIEIVFMNGLQVNPAGYGKIIWDPEKKTAILQISNLPPVPSDKDYQLWVIKDNKPTSAGVFTVNDPSKEIFFKISQLVETDKKSISAFAITLEPKGGVPQPTGQMYLLGSPTL